jgi:hypothetical protein
MDPIAKQSDSCEKTVHAAEAQAKSGSCLIEIDGI